MVGGSGGGHELLRLPAAEGCYVTQVYLEAVMNQMGATSVSPAIAGLTQASSHCAQVVHQGAGHAFYIDDGSMKIDVMDGSPFSTATRASPATVQWLVDNYETCEGTSLPRSTLYTHYLQHCHDHKHEPMNPASFGKLIRSVFLGLRTRRLGTRGNSKYHYYGIRVKSTSALHHTLPEDMGIAARQVVALPKRTPVKPGSVSSDDVGGSRSHDRPGSVAGGGGAAASPASVAGAAAGSGPTSSAAGIQPEQQQYGEFLGTPPDCLLAGVTVQVPATLPLPEGITHDHVQLFEQQYKEHCKAILEAVMCIKLPAIETLWQQFWCRAPVATGLQPSLVVPEPGTEQLGMSKLVAICSWPPVLDFIRHCDYAFYQVIVSVLVPDVLRPIPSGLTQTIRSFAKNLEGWLTSATLGLPDVLIRTKAGVAAALSQMLRRYTSLNHLAQAARAVLQNPTHLEQMLNDLNRVDFSNVQEQASWVCQCDDAMVTQLQQDFKQCLQQQQTLEEWADWLEEVVVDVLKLQDTVSSSGGGAADGSSVRSGCSGASSKSGGGDLPRVARLFLLKWSFYSSMVIRDLTLRSAASFGSFHLIRLLFDEYMFYIVEHRVADAVGDTPISIMAKLNDLTSGGMLEAAFGTAAGAGAPSPPSTPPAAANGGPTAGFAGAVPTALGNGSTLTAAAAVPSAAPGSSACVAVGLGSGTTVSLKPTAGSETLAKKMKYT